jgi:hypothetical protein
MEKGNLPEGGRTQSETGPGEQGYLGKAPVLFDRRENPREITELPGFDLSCAYHDTEICGRCGAC